MKASKAGLAIVLLIFGMTIAGSTSTLYVPSEFADIQTAINAAQSGDTVLVAAGVYSGSGNTGLTVVEKRLYIAGAGGAEATTIDGLGTALAGFGAPYGEIYTGTVIDGFTVTGASHGLLVCSDGALVRNCRFVNNGVAGISADYYRNPACSVVACTIEENPTGFAPFYYDRSPAVAATNEDYEHRFVFEGCTFENNEVAVETFAEIRDCTLTDNQIVFKLHVYPWVHVYNSEIYGNDSAIALLTGEQNDVADRGSLFLFDCLIHDNQGGISRGASLDRPFGRLYMSGCLYYHNNGRIEISPLPYASVIEHCTFADNTAFALRLSAPRDISKHHDVSNNIIAFNQGAGVRYDTASTGLSLLCNDVFANDSCDYCGTTGDPSYGPGNISVDPLFVHSAETPYGLSESSECLIISESCALTKGWTRDEGGTQMPAVDTIPPAAIWDLH